MLSRLALLVFASAACGAASAACGAGATLPRDPPAAPAAQTLDARLHELNARAREEGVTEVLHGITVHDPYRALESSSPLTETWVEAQTERTTRAIDALRSEERERRLTELLSIGYVDEVAVGGKRVFATVREGTREQAALYALTAAPELGTPLVDPLQHGERAAIDWFFPSPDDRYVAFGLSQNGDERSVLHVVDVASGALLAERIGHAKWTNVTWLSDASGFYYTRYPAEGEPRYDAGQPDSYFPGVFFHRLGSDAQSDVRVWQSDVATDFPFPALSSDDRYLVLHNSRTWTATDVHLFDRGQAPAARPVAPDDDHPLVPVIAGEDRETSGFVHDGTLYLLTNVGAPRRRIVRVPAANAGKIGAWTDVVPEGAGTIESWALAGDELVVHTVEALHSRLLRFDARGAARGEIALPTAGSVESLGGSPEHGTLAFTFGSYFYPPAIFTRAEAGGDVAQRYQVANDLDLSAFTVTQALATSRDGTRVPVQLVHRRGLEKDGHNPVLLTGYGGFDVSLLPEFTRSALYWLELGGVYAVANLRGGGELGESWRRAGMLAGKPRVFEDFEAVLELLVNERYSNPVRIAISGGSNGGLLVAATLTRAPQRFAAAVAQVGLYDMLRYHLFPPAALWATEYGDPRDPEAARFLYGYSPYHHVTPGTHYPAALIETADHDTRVHWAHSTKLAAALQEAQAGSRPIYFYMEREQGHGSGTRLRDLVARAARTYAFVERELGLR